MTPAAVVHHLGALLNSALQSDWTSLEEDEAIREAIALIIIAYLDDTS